jgi:hypothetical protein
VRDQLSARGGGGELVAALRRYEHPPARPLVARPRVVGEGR